MSAISDEVDEFIVGASRSLLRTAYLLSGDHAEAEDVVQTALVKVWRNWSKVKAAHRPEEYARRVVVNEFLGSRRRHWWRESPMNQMVEHAAVPSDFRAVEDRADLRGALAALSPGQRAVLVLRYFDDLTERQTADALGISVGTVKSQCARALERLRTSLATNVCREDA